MQLLLLIGLLLQSRSRTQRWPRCIPPFLPCPHRVLWGWGWHRGGQWTSPWRGAEAGHPGTLRVLRDPPNPPRAPCLFAEAPWLNISTRRLRESCGGSKGCGFNPTLLQARVLVEAVLCGT